jgi:glycosyltransferase involved in cell wall biosynthesis
MKLSIITITYNAEAVLERTLQSVAVQTCRDFEYLIVDGKSKDATLTLVEAYQQIVSRCISEPDKGIYDAMNKGLREAKGDYVWFMNAGDQIYDENVVAAILQRIEQTNADVLYGDTLLVDDQNNAIGLRSQHTPHKLPEQLTVSDFKMGMVVCHQAFIARKTITQPYLLNHYYSADVDWEINCVKNAKLIENLKIVVCRYLTGGFSIKNLRKSLWDRFIILQKHFGFISTLGIHFLILLRGLSLMWQKKGKYW